MMTTRAAVLVVVAGSILTPAMTGCEALPGRPREQGAVGGAVAGAIIGGATAGTWWAGALIGGGIGLVGGWLIGFAIEEWFGWNGNPPRAEMSMPMGFEAPDQTLVAREGSFDLADSRGLVLSEGAR